MRKLFSLLLTIFLAITLIDSTSLAESSTDDIISAAELPIDSREGVLAAASTAIAQMTDGQKTVYLEILEEYKDAILAYDWQYDAHIDAPINRPVVISDVGSDGIPELLMVYAEGERACTFEICFLPTESYYGEPRLIRASVLEDDDPQSTFSFAVFAVGDSAYCVYRTGVDSDGDFNLYVLNDVQHGDISEEDRFTTMRIRSYTDPQDDGSYLYDAAESSDEFKPISEEAYFEFVSSVVPTQVFLYSYLPDADLDGHPVWSQIFELGDLALSYDEAIELLRR